jgi:hypothetical protein
MPTVVVNDYRASGGFMLRTAALVLAALMLTGLTGCTASYVYVRADGRDFAEDQALYQQFETDRMTCQGEGHSSNIPSNAAYHSTGDVGGNARDCMGKKGYRGAVGRGRAQAAGPRRQSRREGTA